MAGTKEKVVPQDADEAALRDFEGMSFKEYDSTPEFDSSASSNISDLQFQ